MVCLPKSGLNDFVRKAESKDENKQMKNKKLLFDRKCHVLYSKPCKKEILAKIALHYPEAERETVWEQVQRQYAVYLSDWRTDLAAKRTSTTAQAVPTTASLSCAFTMCVGTWSHSAK